MRKLFTASVMALTVAVANAEVTTGSLAMKIEQRKKQIQSVEAEIQKLSTARVMLEGSLRELAELAQGETTGTVKRRSEEGDPTP